MRDETQATHLETMMRKHRGLQTYELALAPVEIKRNVRKRLQQGDIIRLQMEYPLLYLFCDGKMIATAALDLWQHAVEVTMASDAEEMQNSKKHDTLLCSFGEVQSQEIKTGVKVDITSLEMSRVSLKVDGKTVAQGRLVWADESLAVEITKAEQ